MSADQETELVCTPKGLGSDMRFKAAIHAIEINPLNRPPVERMLKISSAEGLMHPYISVLTNKRWRTNGVRLSVQFMDNPDSALRERILGHMNAWGDQGNVAFTETHSQGQVRIAREPDGYWSYLGTDILLIDPNQQTMNLQGFTMNTRDSEFYRVVRHETGHTLGMPHEHMRRELVEQLDVEKTVAYFGATQGWTREEVVAQVLTPLEESSLFGTPYADAQSIMCYQIPGQLTKTGRPIPGGVDINPLDHQFCGMCYPK